MENRYPALLCRLRTVEQDGNSHDQIPDPDLLHRSALGGHDAVKRHGVEVCSAAVASPYRAGAI
jgi:hypothetical protein